MNQEWFIPSFLITLMAQDGWSRVETQALICKLQGAHTHKIKGPRAQPDATGNSLVVEAEVLEAFLEEAVFEPQMLWN